MGITSGSSLHAGIAQTLVVIVSLSILKTIFPAGGDRKQTELYVGTRQELFRARKNEATVSTAWENDLNSVSPIAHTTF